MGSHALTPRAVPHWQHQKRGSSYGSVHTSTQAGGRTCTGPPVKPAASRQRGGGGGRVSCTQERNTLLYPSPPPPPEAYQLSG